MADHTLEDITVTTTETSLFISVIDKAVKKSLFLINNGPNQVTFRIYGSPDGITVENFTSIKSGVAKYTQAQVDLHYILTATVVVPSNDNHLLDLTDYVYDFIKLTVQSAAGESIINYKLQKAYSGIGA